MSMYDKQREADLAVIVQALSSTIQSAIRCCPNCLHFDNVRETCDKANNKHPPAKVIAFGCETFNGIPPF